MEPVNKTFKPADFLPCPICQGPVQWSWCAGCQTHTVINWGPLFMPVASS